MQIYFKFLGCRLNEAELENWIAGFRALGHGIASSPEEADMIVINSCAVTNEAVKKSRQLIRRSHRNNPNAKLVVSGCYASLNGNLTDEIAGIDLVVPNQDKDRLVEIVNETLLAEAMPAIATEPAEASLFAQGRNRAFIKVQDGCRYRCTFCIVTIARGAERSRPVAEIISQVNRLSSQGVKEVVLTGVHLGGYGGDMGTDLHSLLQAILMDTDIPRVRLGSVEPWDLPENFFQLFADPRLMPHLHLPLQSGSDAVLRSMARRCKRADFARLIEQARSEISDFNVTTDIIVGFPGESDEAWQKGLTYIEKIGFSHIHIFPYSPRSGTKAATMASQIPPDIKKERCRQLHAVAKKSKQAYMENFIGREFPVLFENRCETEEPDYFNYFGYTPNFLKVQVTSASALPLENSIKRTKLAASSAADNCMLAEILS